jgi:actin cytoskeleton-regulatory complex protein SLA1
MVFIGLYRALYDYAPQADNEIAIQDGDLLFILEKGDDDWWKAKKKATSDDLPEPEGLIPGNYVEPAKPLGRAKALYEYTRQTDEEISFPDEAELDVYDMSDADWTLVGFNGEYGFAPFNYIEPEEAPPPMPNRPRPAQQEPTPEPEEETLPAQPHRRIPTSSPEESPVNSPAAALAGIMQSRQPSSSRSVPLPPPDIKPARKKVQFTPEGSDEEPPPRLPQRPPSESYTAPVSKPKKQVRIKKHEPEPEPEPEPRPKSPPSGVVISPPHNRAVSMYFDEDRSLSSPGGFHLYNIYEVVEVLGKNRRTPVTLGINIAKGVIMISSDNSREKEWTADKLKHYSMEGKHVFMELVRPSKSIDFHAGAKDTASEIMSALGDLAGAAKVEDLREALAAGSGQKIGTILYDFSASDSQEVSVSVGDEVIILDDVKDADWWLVRRTDNGAEGTVPSSYVEITRTQSKAPAASRSSTSKKTSFVDQNRRDEERLTREATKSRGEVGPGLQLPERGSSLSQDRRTSQRESQDARRSSSRKTCKLP